MSTPNQHGAKVGDILVSLWGYDQTNVDFYEVTAVTRSTVVIRRIAAERDYTGSMVGHARPLAGEFLSDHAPLRRRTRPAHTQAGYGCAGQEPYQWCRPWSGDAVMFTEYA
jgi:hypothetical protein